MAELPPGLAETRKALPKPTPKAKPVSAKQHSSPVASHHSSPIRDESPKRKTNPKASKKICTNPERWTLIEGKTNYALWSKRLGRYLSAPAVERKSSSHKKTKRAPRYVTFELIPFYPRVAGFILKEAVQPEVLEVQNLENNSVIATVDLTRHNLRSDLGWQFRGKEDEDHLDDEPPENDAAEHTLLEFSRRLKRSTAYLEEEEGFWRAKFEVQAHPVKEGSNALALTEVKVKLVRQSKRQKKREEKTKKKLDKEVAELEDDLKGSSFQPKEGRRTRRTLINKEVYNAIVGKTPAKSSEEEEEESDPSEEE